MDDGKAEAGHVQPDDKLIGKLEADPKAMAPRKPRLDWLSGFSTVVATTPSLVPQVLWFVLALFALIIFSGPALKLLDEGRISKIAVGIFEVDVAQDVAAHFKPGVGIPRTPVLFKPIADRAKMIQDKLVGSVVLWVDNKNPSQNVQERRVLQNFGISFDMAQSTEEAEQWMDRYHYDAVISNINRPKEDNNDTPCFSEPEPKGAGCAMAKKMHDRYGDDLPPIIFYSANYPQSVGTPPFSIGVTNRMDRLFGLVFDAIERRQTDEVSQ